MNRKTARFGALLATDQDSSTFWVSVGRPDAVLNIESFPHLLIPPPTFSHRLPPSLALSSQVLNIDLSHQQHLDALKFEWGKPALSVIVLASTSAAGDNWAIAGSARGTQGGQLQDGYCVNGRNPSARLKQVCCPEQCWTDCGGRRGYWYVENFDRLPWWYNMRKHAARTCWETCCFDEGKTYDPVYNRWVRNGDGLGGPWDDWGNHGRPWTEIIRDLSTGAPLRHASGAPFRRHADFKGRVCKDKQDTKCLIPTEIGSPPTRIVLSEEGADADSAAGNGITARRLRLYLSEPLEPWRPEFSIKEVTENLPVSLCTSLYLH